MRRHPKLMAFMMWLVMAAITVAGFGAYEATHPAAPPPTTHANIPDVLSIVGGVGRATATLPNPVSTTAGIDPPPSVERWRPLVAEFFPGEAVDRALGVMWCESRGNPDAIHVGSGAAGLFQHLPEFWADRSEEAGHGGADIHDEEANIAVAGWLFGRDGWSHWVASEACWGE